MGKPTPLDQPKPPSRQLGLSDESWKLIQRERAKVFAATGYLVPITQIINSALAKALGPSVK